MGYLDIEAKSRRGRLPGEPLEWKPWLTWVGATGFGYIAGSFLLELAGLVGSIFTVQTDLRSAIWVKSILYIAVIGAVVGLAQSLVLWKYTGLPIQRAWVIASAVGSGLGLAGLFLFTGIGFAFLFCGPLPFIVPGGLFGAGVGLAQRRVLRQHLDESSRWLWVNALAGVVALLPLYAGLTWAISSFVANGAASATTANLDVWLISLLTGWSPAFLYGAVTGAEMVRLMRLYRLFPKREVRY